MIEPLEAVRDTIPLVRWHHERMDGAGYPDRLTGDKIPYLVRILSVADVYDALSSDRPYRSSLRYDACLDVLRRDAEQGGLDPDLVAEFCKIPPEILAKTSAIIPNQAPRPLLSDVITPAPLTV
jgi:putative two-component system response regulator